ncbi:MAG: NAD(P)-binding protein [Clostridia bacterium]|nr:NAD(P)-binding protein [Clostridia bacterium]
MLRIRQVKIEVLSDTEDNLLKAVAKKLNISFDDIETISIFKKSIDARNKNEIFYVYEVNACVKGEASVLKKVKSADVFTAPDTGYKFSKTGTETLKHPPVIVGAGPAGLFAAYILCENGYKPVIIERGEDIDTRLKTVENFWKNGILNKNSNVQFGEGGAGTFSDGKLNTLIKDKDNRCRKVLETFVKFGAPEIILYEQKPHIGTDLLSKVIKNMREAIISMGGTVMYNSCLTDIIEDNGILSAIVINGEKTVPCDALVLAIGHSARDTFSMIHSHGIDMRAKPFAVGVRVQHSQDMINLSQYGAKYKDVLPPASYKLTYQTKDGRGVYTFCMCPGGYVVNASSEDGRLAVNGMSYNDRGGDNANSAVIVTVTPDDFGTNPLDGVEFQRLLEEKAYNAGCGKIPAQLLGDFKYGKVSLQYGDVKPCFKGDAAFADINDILPENICKALKEAFSDFGKKIKGFDNNDSILAAVESRTSSPVRIERGDDGMSSIKGIYPCGEGAGYAGGITSAAMDGIKTAEKIGSRYK